jgi:hypothetical protein
MSEIPSNNFSAVESESEIRELAPIGWGEIAPGGSGFEREPAPIGWGEIAPGGSGFEREPEPEVAPKFTPLPFYGAGPDGEGLLPRLGY